MALISSSRPWRTSCVGGVTRTTSGVSSSWAASSPHSPPAVGTREWGEFVSGGPPLPELQRLALHLLDLQVEFGSSLTSVRVLRDLNVRADYLSHVSAMPLHRYFLREECASRFACLEGLWTRMPRTVGRFASADNRHSRWAPPIRPASARSTSTLARSG